MGCDSHFFFYFDTFPNYLFRPDRDEYIKINWENIKPGKEGNFGKRTEVGITEFYDFKSIMHYEANAFSINGQKTIGECVIKLVKLTLF